jgi:hypothetical protein
MATLLLIEIYYLVTRRSFVLSFMLTDSGPTPMPIHIPREEPYSDVGDRKIARGRYVVG